MFSIKELVEDDLHGVEPVHQRGPAAGRDTDVVVPLAEVPHPHLIEVVQAGRFCDGLLEFGVRAWVGEDYVRGIDFEEIQIAEDVVVGQVADLDEDQHDERDEEKDAGGDSEALSVLRSRSQIGFREIGRCFRVGEGRCGG